MPTTTPATTPATTSATGRTYHHGNLAETLVEAGVVLARHGGPDAVVVREASRRAGVSHNAAYRHFADRDAFLEAVCIRCFRELALGIEAALDAVPPGGPAVETAWARLRAAGAGYIEFAIAEPGWFRTAFAVPPEDLAGAADPLALATGAGQPREGTTGASGLNAYELLSRCLDELVGAGALPAQRRPGAEIAAWSLVHGYATLLVEGPLRTLSPVDRVALQERVLGTVAAGL